MAEGRMLKKVICESPRLAALKNDTHRLIYTWLIPHLDIEGRHSADPRILKSHIAPILDHITYRIITTALNDMAINELITLYSIDDKQYLELLRFKKHQHLRADHEKGSDIPPPTPGGGPENARTTTGGGPENARSTPKQFNLSKDNIIKDKGEHPTIEQVTAYCLERKNQVDPQKWHDHYTSNGWMVGKNKMKDWKAAVRTWEKSEFSGNGKKTGRSQPESSPYKTCSNCGEEYQETDMIDIQGVKCCPKCPEAREESGRLAKASYEKVMAGIARSRASP